MPLTDAQMDAWNKAHGLDDASMRPILSRNAKKTNEARKKGILYYKDPSYLAKNWAPEEIPEASLRALAQAQALAQQKGILSPALAKQFLANSLVEGYTGGPSTVTMDKGVGDEGEDDQRQVKEHSVGHVPSTSPTFGADSLGYDGPDIQKNLGAMGLKYQEANNFDQFAAAMKSYDEQPHPGAPHLSRNAMPGEPVQYATMSSWDADTNAKLAAVILAKKAALYGEDKAIERWNGSGPDARRHASRVATMQQMLSHPANAGLMNAYQAFLASHLPQQQPTQQPMPRPIQQQLPQQQSPYAGILAQQYLGQ